MSRYIYRNLLETEMSKIQLIIALNVSTETASLISEWQYAVYQLW